MFAPIRFALITAVSTAMLPALAAPVGTASGQSADGSFKPTHVYAWSETAGDGGTLTSIYLFDREIPADGWADAEDRGEDIRVWTQKAKAPLMQWTLEADGKVDSILDCDADGTCSSRGLSTINDVASAVAKIERIDGKRIRGTLQEGSGACGDQWCEVLESYTVDAPLAPPPLIDRTLSTGRSDTAEATAARDALLAYWAAAGKAKASQDLDGYFSATRRAHVRRQTDQYGAEAETLFVKMFVPAHGGKPEISQVRVLGDAAVAKLKTQAGTPEDRYELQCEVLLRNESGSWKIGIERC